MNILTSLEIDYTALVHGSGVICTDICKCVVDVQSKIGLLRSNINVFAVVLQGLYKLIEADIETTSNILKC